MKLLPSLCLGVFLSVSVIAQDAVDPVQAELDVIEAQLIGDADLVTLDVDGALWEDEEIMTAALASLPDGEAPRSVRKLVAGVVAEMNILLSKRISGDLLTLDDGTKVDARSGRKKAAKKKKTHGATIIFDSDGRGQPDRIVIRTGNGVRCLMFPTGEASGPPQIGNKCAIKN